MYTQRDDRVIPHRPSSLRTARAIARFDGLTQGQSGVPRTRQTSFTQCRPAVAITRRMFLIQLASGGWTLTAGGCGGGGDNAAAPAPAPAGAGCTATIAGNHGHVLAIAAVDINSLVDITYDIHGTADHTHSVTFTAAQLAQLKAGSMVSATTTTALAHNHAISEQCT
jgi:hypothetical protein